MGNLLAYLCLMLTKYYIEIDGVKSEVPKGCLKNWEEIKCVYKRSDFSGVTRSFTTQFEFVGEMYDRLMALYLRDGVNARAAISLYTITNEWAWEERFTADLDFSSITWDSYVLKMNCIDESLSASIKARKSTKFEFVVGEDIPISNELRFDRITMQNSCAHEIMGDGTASEDSDEVKIIPDHMKRLPTYLIGDGETYEDSPVLFQDQDKDGGSCFLEAVKEVENLEIEVEIKLSHPESHRCIIDNAQIFLMSFAKGDKNYSASTYTNLCEVLNYSTEDMAQRNYLGVYPTFDVLRSKYPTAPDNSWALVGKDWETAEEAYISPIGNISPKEWIPATAGYVGGRNTPPTGRRCSVDVFKNKIRLTKVPVGTCFALFFELSMHRVDPYGSEPYFMRLASSIKTRWTSKAKPITIDAIKPKAVLDSLMAKIVENGLNIETQIKDTDARIAKTYLLAAESVRDIPGAKFYTSFDDFCDWMETVFGYTYCLGDRKRSRFSRLQEYAFVLPLDDNHLYHTPCPVRHGSQVFIIEGTPYFAVVGENTNADGTLNLYTKWVGCTAYNDTATGKARLDTLFYDTDHNQGCYFDDDYTLQSYVGDVGRGLNDSQTIHFVPRAELFAGTKTVELKQIRGLEFSINKNLAYSSLTIGYEKQEYEAECGRDEWNFSAQYTTGVDQFEKKLSLVSKYRADCYGLEFLSQERAKDTKDNKSDSTVFFVYCTSYAEETESGGEDTAEITRTTTLRIDRTGSTISGALSSDVFNGVYAPLQCVKANAAYIAAVKCPLTLKFASFDGNADISIDGVLCSADLNVNEQLFTLGEVHFDSANVDTELDVNALYEVQSHGITYRGFLKEVSYKYAKAETAKYKLIVKEIEL